MLDSIRDCLSGRGVDPECTAGRVRRLRYFQTGSARPAAERAASLRAPDDVEEDGAQLALPYFAVVSRRAKVRRLHRVGGCSTRSGAGAARFEEFATLPDASRYTAICKTCWKEGVAREEGAGSVSSAGSSDSSESSSSAPTAKSVASEASEGGSE